MQGKGVPLVLIHSRWVNGDQWDDQVRAFAPHYRVIRYDMRGFGRSPMELVPYDDVDDLYRLLQFLKIEKTFVLGLSLGAQVAIEFAFAHPEMVRGLIAVGADLYDYEGWSDRFNEEWAALAAAAREDRYAEAVDRIIEMWVNGPIRPARPEVQARMRALMAGYTFIDFKPIPQPEGEAKPEDKPLTSETPVPARERFGTLAVPTLIIVGDKDWPEIVEQAGLLVDYLPDGEKVVITDAAHIVNLDQPEAFNRAVLEFVGRHA
jgi:pimeloyl-ACP methyl ester carboxylesterase